MVSRACTSSPSSRSEKVSLIRFLRQKGEVLLLHLDQPQSLPRVLVHDGLDGRGLSRSRKAVEQRVVGRKAGEETLCVRDQGFPLSLVGDQLVEAHGVRA